MEKLLGNQLQDIINAYVELAAIKEREDTKNIELRTRLGIGLDYKIKNQDVEKIV